ncbi:polyprotein 1 [Arracacha virus B]|uniref:Polyprotein 1 n=1 Tax=Arracacha virus B TaxID=257463 RepID=A0ABX8F5K5_9SECO|nr:polyprotein 1 [Arracacha virus B]QVX32640.1 polyprotein 1 [Arracacha virus B]
MVACSLGHLAKFKFAFKGKSSISCRSCSKAYLLSTFNSSQELTGTLASHAKKCGVAPMAAPKSQGSICCPNCKETGLSKRQFLTSGNHCLPGYGGSQDWACSYMSSSERAFGATTRALNALSEVGFGSIGEVISSFNAPAPTATGWGSIDIPTEPQFFFEEYYSSPIGPVFQAPVDLNLLGLTLEERRSLGALYRSAIAFQVSVEEAYEASILDFYRNVPATTQFVEVATPVVKELSKFERLLPLVTKVAEYFKSLEETTAPASAKVVEEVQVLPPAPIFEEYYSSPIGPKYICLADRDHLFDSLSWELQGVPLSSLLTDLPECFTEARHFVDKLISELLALTQERYLGCWAHFNPILSEECPKLFNYGAHVALRKLLRDLADRRKRKEMKPFLRRRADLQNQRFAFTCGNIDRYVGEAGFDWGITRLKKFAASWGLTSDTIAQGAADFVKKVMSLLDPFGNMLGAMKSFFYDSLERLKTNLLEKLKEHWLVAGIGISFIISFALLVAVACVLKLFVGLCSFIGLPKISFMTIWLAVFTAFLFFLGIDIITMDPHAVQAMGSSFMSFLCQTQEGGIVRSYMFDSGDSSATGQGPEIVFEGLTNFVNILISTVAGTCKAANAASRTLSGVSTLGGNVKKCASTFITSLISACQVMGNGHVHSLMIINQLVDKDFQTWSEGVRDYAFETWKAAEIPPIQRLEILRGLDDTRKDFEKILMMPGVNPPEYLRRCFDACSTALRERIAELSRAAMFDISRIPPFWIYLYSARGGTGKSTCAIPLANKILDSANEPKGARICTRNAASSYLNGYAHQPCLIMDEFGAQGEHHATPDERIILDYVSATPMIPNMAAVNDKTIMFNSKLIISTSNFPNGNPKVDLGNNKTGFLRRRKIFAEVAAPLPGEQFPQFSFRDGTNEELPFLDLSLTPSQTQVWVSWHQFHAKCSEVYNNYRIQEAGVLNLYKEEEENTGIELKRRLRAYMLIRSSTFSDYSEVEVDAFIEKYLAFDACAWNRFVTNEDFEKWMEEYSIASVWKRDLEKMSITEIYSLLTRSEVSKIAASITANGDIEEGVIATSAFEYFCLKVIQAKLRTEYFTARSRSCFDVTKVEGFIPQMLQWLREILYQIPSWCKLVLAAALFLLVGYTIIKAAAWIFSGVAFSVAHVAAFCAFKGEEISPSNDATPTKKPGGAKVSWEMRMSRSDQAKFEDIGYGAARPAAGQNWADFYGEGPLKDNSELVSFLKHVAVMRNIVTEQDYHLLFIAGRKALFVQHVFKSMPVGTYQLIVGDCVIDKFFFNRDALQCKSLTDKDLCIVTMSHTVPPFAPLAKRLLFDEEEKLPRQALGFFCHSEPYVELDRISGISHRMQKLEQTVYENPDILYETSTGLLPLKKAYKYEMVTSPGFCGDVLLQVCSSGVKILGMHTTAGKQSIWRYANTVTLQDIEGAYPSEWVGEEPDLPISNTSRDFCAGEVARVGTNEGLKPHFPTKTSLVPSIISSDLKEDDDNHIPSVMTPAILHSRDPRIVEFGHEGFDPFKDGMLKYTRAAGPFDEADEDFQDALDDVFLDIGDLRTEKEIEQNQSKAICRILNENDTLNGGIEQDFEDPIVSKTAEGYPFCCQRPPGKSGKGWLLGGIPGDWSLKKEGPLNDAIEHLEDNLANEVFEPLIGIDFPKDEKVMRAKVEVKPKVRLFTILPFHYNLVVRRFYLDFVARLMQKHNETPVKVGLNTSSLEWQHLYDQLSAVGFNWFNGDYSRFDGITPRCVLQGLAIRISKFYRQDEAQGLVSKKKIRTSVAHSLLLDMANSRYGIAGLGVYKVSSGIPSGFPLTVIVNSLVNSFFLHFAYRKLMSQSLKSHFWFTKNVAFAVYGDDNLVSVSESIKNVYNLKTIAHFLTQFGVTLKNGANKDEEILSSFYPIEGVDFLKRTFVPFRGVMLDRLNKENTLERLHWVRKGTDEIDAILDNCGSCLLECIAHGPEFYEDIRSKLVRVLGKRKLPCNFPDFETAFTAKVNGQSFVETCRAVNVHIPPPIVYISENSYSEYLWVEGVFVCPYARRITFQTLYSEKGCNEKQVVCVGSMPANARRGLHINISLFDFNLLLVLRVFKMIDSKCVYFVDLENNKRAALFATLYGMYIGKVDAETAVKMLVGQKCSEKQIMSWIDIVKGAKDQLKRPSTLNRSCLINVLCDNARFPFEEVLNFNNINTLIPRNIPIEFQSLCGQTVKEVLTEKLRQGALRIDNYPLVVEGSSIVVQNLISKPGIDYVGYDFQKGQTLVLEYGCARKCSPLCMGHFHVKRKIQQFVNTISPCDFPREAALRAAFSVAC